MFMPAGKLMDILSRSERRTVLLLLLLQMGVAVFEVMGLASVMPLLALVGDPGIIQENRWVHMAYAMLGAESDKQFIMYCGIFSLGMLLVSNIVRFAVTWAMLRFTHMTNYTLSKRMFRMYILQPYRFFFDHNSSDIIKNVLGEVASVCCYVLQNAMIILSRCAIVIAIMIFMIFVNPLVSLAVFVCFGGSYVLAYVLTRRVMERVSKKRLEATERRFRIAGETFRSIKEVKAANSELFFYDKFAEASESFARQCTVNEVVAMSPRYCLEVVAYGAMVVLVMVFFMSGWNIGHILPLLGVYALGGMKMMPALQQVFAGMTNIRFYLPALNLLHSDFMRYGTDEAEQEAHAGKIAFEREIRFEEVSFAYSQEAGLVLNGLNMTISRNSMVGIVGTTGAGKTTAIDMLLGLLPPDSGRLLVDGVPVHAGNMRAWRRHIGYVPQIINLLDDSVRMNIALGVPAAEVDEARLVSAARAASIHEHVMQNMPDGYDTVVGEQGVCLSGGQRQRIGIARALYHGADVLVLDEATSALDADTERRVMESIAGLAGEMTIVIIAHRLSTLEQCDAIYLFENGRAHPVGNYADLCARNGLFTGRDPLAPRLADTGAPADADLRGAC